MNRDHTRFMRSMADAARIFFILAAFVASARARYRWGAIVALVCAVVVVLEIYVGLRFAVRPAPIEVALGAIFLGPSSLPHASPFAASALLMDPLHHVVLAALGGGAARGAFVRASELRPEGIDARRLDAAGLRFVAIAVIHGLLMISGALMHLVGSEP